MQLLRALTRKELEAIAKEENVVLPIGRKIKDVYVTAIYNAKSSK